MILTIAALALTSVSIINAFFDTNVFEKAREDVGAFAQKASKPVVNVINAVENVAKCCQAGLPTCDFKYYKDGQCYNTPNPAEGSASQNPFH